MDRLTRYLVRRATKEVFIWTELLSKNHLDLEEVMAADPQAALGTKALPDPRHISIVELESMKKTDLIIWAGLKLGLVLDASKKIADLVTETKLAIFNIPAPSGAPDEVEVDMRNAAAGQAVTRSTPMASAGAARARKGA